MNKKNTTITKYDIIRMLYTLNVPKLFLRSERKQSRRTRILVG